MHAIHHNAPRVSFHAYLKILTTIVLALCTFISVYAENMTHNESKRKRPRLQDTALLWEEGLEEKVWD